MKCSGTDLCQKCYDSMMSTLAFTVISIIFIFFALCANIARHFSALNTFKVKVTSVVSSFCAICAGIIAVVSFVKGCYEPFKDYDFGAGGDDTSADDIDVIFDFKWIIGPACIIMIIVILLEFIDMVGNLIAPIETAGDAEYAKTTTESAAVQMDNI